MRLRELRCQPLDLRTAEARAKQRSADRLVGDVVDTEDRDRELECP